MLKVKCEMGLCNQWAMHYDAILGFVILPEKANPKPARFYEIDFRYSSDAKQSVKKSFPHDAKVVFTMADEDFVDFVKGKLNPKTAYDKGLMTIKGDMEVAAKLVPEIFPYPSDKNRIKLADKSEGTIDEKLSGPKL